ncbi:hypothetical protein ACGFNU_21000 [Spirillospora sp. NPDC048911]|uniref:hypothetical protein n=1 Tax=Spirillospora sp. NPDC048911 TaxID=3364527 RepID=UPI0037150D07
MSRSDWIASAAALAAFLSVGVALFAIKYARDSAKHSGRSADHAGESAAEARQLREIEAERRKEERERRHDDLGPNLPAEIEAEQEGELLYGEITVPRAYRVRAYARSGDSLTQLSVDPVTVPNRPLRFVIEHLHPEQSAIHTEEIFFHFWPPEESDQVPVWSCGCGLDTSREVMGDKGHWKAKVEVTFHDVMESVW